jgi:hypothetical protein
MSLTNAAEQAFLDLLFLNVDWQNIGDAGGLLQSVASGSFYISLHTADPGEGGDQTTNETTYTNYSRVAVTRDAGGWLRTASTISNVSKITFPQCTGGIETITHFGIGTAPTSTGNLLMKGVLTSAILITNGIQPEFVAGSLTAAVD